VITPPPSLPPVQVLDAKALVRADMIAEGLAAVYWEPEDEVRSRSGDEVRREGARGVGGGGERGALPLRRRGVNA
jgi:hypothetical protein